MQTGKTSTPFTILGTIIAIMAIFVWLWVFNKFYKSYQSSGKKQSQYFSLALLFGALSIIMLAFELVTFQVFDNNTPWGNTYIGKDILPGLNSFQVGITFAIIAAVISAFSLFFFATFSLSFFEDKMKWAIIPGLLIAFYIFLYLYFFPTVQLNADGTDYDVTRSSQVELAMIALFIGPIFMPVVVFLISALQSRGNTFNFRRSLILSLMFLDIGIGYTIEIVGATSAISVVARLLILFFPIGVNLTLNPNNFMKRLLGAAT